MKRIINLLVPVCLVFLSGCVAYNVIKPVSPRVGNPKQNPVMVTTLQPVLTWEASGDKDATYDLIVYEGLKDQSFWKGVSRSVGEQVYYKEGISGNMDTVKTVLKPKTEYYWSVRVRKGSEVSEWSHYDYTVFLVLSYMKVDDVFFRFRTPDVVQK
jgi:hypothetical protein